tara:strand:+ start:500 stop:811 length:312 start_codon:yes stop_codon:yes gene_type:complete
MKTITERKETLMNHCERIANNPDDPFCSAGHTGGKISDQLNGIVSDLREAVEGKKIIFLASYLDEIIKRFPDGVEREQKLREIEEYYNQALDQVLSILDELEK